MGNRLTFKTTRQSVIYETMPLPDAVKEIIFNYIMQEKVRFYDYTAVLCGKNITTQVVDFHMPTFNEVVDGGILFQFLDAKIMLRIVGNSEAYFLNEKKFKCRPWFLGRNTTITTDFGVIKDNGVTLNFLSDIPIVKEKSMKYPPKPFIVADDYFISPYSMNAVGKFKSEVFLRQNILSDGSRFIVETGVKSIAVHDTKNNKCTIITPPISGIKFDAYDVHLRNGFLVVTLKQENVLKFIEVYELENLTNAKRYLVESSTEYEYTAHFNPRDLKFYNPPKIHHSSISSRYYKSVDEFGVSMSRFCREFGIIHPEGIEVPASSTLGNKCVFYYDFV